MRVGSVVLRTVAGAVIAVAVAGWAAAAGAAPMATLESVLANYNVYVQTNMNHHRSDSEGPIAVGGNLSTSSFGIASGLPDNTTPPFNDALFVGGNFTHHNGNIDGSVSVGGNVNLHRTTVFGNVTAGGTLKLKNGTIEGSQTPSGTPALPNFAAIGPELVAAAQELSALAANGATSVASWGGLSLTGTDPTLNVFSVSGHDLNKANTFNITAPSGSTVIVNIDGHSHNFHNLGFGLNGVANTDVLYNFYDSNAINTSGVSIQGSILAPLASANFNNGNIEGTFIANHMNGTGEFHDYRFIGTLPGGGPPIVASEPAGLALFLIGLAGMGLTLCYRRDDKAAAPRPKVQSAGLSGPAEDGPR